jgi:hypothetical protein
MPDARQGSEMEVPNMVHQKTHLVKKSIVLSMVADASWMPFDKFSEGWKFFEDWPNSEYFRRLKKSLKNDQISEYFKRRDRANQIVRSRNMQGETSARQMKGEIQVARRGNE